MAASTSYHLLYFRGQRYAPSPRTTLRSQTLACLVGTHTESLLRPFLRRRFSTARPHLVFMRARNPCLFLRRRFRGLYVGFILFPHLRPCKLVAPVT